MEVLKNRKARSNSVIATATVGCQAECAVLCASRVDCAAVNTKVSYRDVTCELLSDGCGVAVETGWTLIKRPGGMV